MFSRRTLLGTATALGVATGLGACTPSGSTGGPSEGGGGQSGTTGNATPTYTAFGGVKPDILGDPKLGIPNGFYRFPEAPPKFTDYPLPRTEPMTILSQGIVGNVPLDKSTWWKMMQTDLGNDLPITITLSAQYTDKFQTLIAGGDLPVMMQMVSAPEMPKLLEAKFTDLGEFIGGDLVSEYPGLASIPTTAWSVPMLNGKLWGIPQARPPAGIIMSTRGDILEAKGIKKDQNPANGAELLAFMKEITDSSAKVFAMGGLPTAWLMRIILEMVDAPNGWVEEGGKFTNAFETPQYKEAIAHTKEFWDAGVLHPNSFSEPGSNSGWWQGGVTQVYIQAFTNWLYFTQRRPEFDMGLVEIPKWDGGGAADKFTSDPAYGAYIGISKQSSPDRVREALRMLDYLAAPYGTEEYLRSNYGVPGEHYNMTDGVPIATERIVDDPRILTYFGSQVLADLTGPKSLVEAESEYLHRIMPTAKTDASNGLYSATLSSKGATFSVKLTDTVNEIIQGRKAMSDFDVLIKDWQNGVGKDIRAELEQAKQQQG